MSGLAGWLDTRGGPPAAETVLRAMAACITRFDSATARSVGCECGTLVAASRFADVHLHRDGARLTAVWGHARLAGAESGGADIAQAVSEAHRRDGTQFLARLSGEFALAIVDGDTREALLAVDRMATHPLAYGEGTERLVFGSNLDAVEAGLGHQAELDLQALYDYVHFHMIPAPLTVYRRVRRLPPGGCLVWKDGVSRVDTYWTMRYTEDAPASFDELKSRFRGLLKESVRAAAAHGRVGTFLSGGTDSSTVAGMLGDVTDLPARTYSIGFEAEGYDEMEYARIAARHFGTRHHEYYVTPEDVVAAIPRIAAVHDQPFGNASAIPTFYCARLAAEDGVETLLGGDGGDELFGGNDRYAKQHLYSLYSDLPAPLRKAVVEPLAALVPAIGIAGKVKRYMHNASEPMPARYDNYNLLQRFGAATVFTPEFLAAVDPRSPAMALEQAYGSAQARTLINRMLALDLKYTLADNDLPKVMRSCELARVDVRFPLMSDELVAFSAALPPRYKLRGTQLRWFFKEALRDYLPPEIITKQKHGFGLPFGPWMQSHARLRELVLDSLEALKGRHIVRATLIDELTSRRVQEHASYFGTMAWILMMLEQWFRRRPAASRAGNGPEVSNASRFALEGGAP